MHNTTTLIGGLQPEKIVKKYGSPVYAYDGDLIRMRCRALFADFPGIDFSYACKANTNPEIVRLIAKEGFAIETVSPGEIAVARAAGVPASRITYTCGSITGEELVSVIRLGIRVHLDSLRQVEIVGKHFPGSEISVRLNQGIGAGAHPHVITGGPGSKFGIDIAHIPQLLKLAKKYRLRTTGLHQHIGSNILDARVFVRAMEVLCNTALQFPDLEHMDFGGGFGVPYKPQEKPLDLALLGKKTAATLAKFAKRYGRTPAFSFEPGRFLVAEAGNLLVTVVDIKRNPTKTFIGVDSGLNHLIRPAMYGSYHEILNATHPRAKKEKVTVAGNMCESGDVFAKDRPLAAPAYGDTLVIKNAGAYGYVMASRYNLRDLPKEILVSNKKAKIIRV